MARDVIIVGGGYAGLSAALQLAGTGRAFSIVDDAAPRNRGLAEARGIFAQDGDAPADIMARARAQLDRYGSAEWIAARAVDVARNAHGFTVTLDDGQMLASRRIILATGVQDVLPDTAGLAQRWRKSVFHCPYCNGHDARGGPIGVLATGTASFALAMLVRDWGPTTLFTDGRLTLDPQQRERLAARDVRVDDGPVSEIVDHATVRMEDGRTAAMAAIFVNTRTAMKDGLAARLGCRFGEGGSGPIIETDAQCETSVPGVFACGDTMRSAGKIALAIGDGAIAGIAAHQSLIFR